MSNLLTAINSIIESRKAREAKLLSEIATANNGVEPKLGEGGRLHAPVQGYMWGSEVYAKGQFLNEILDYKAGGQNTIKVVVTSALRDALKNVLNSAISFGQSWRQDDLSVSYAYISGLTIGEHKELSKFVKISMKSIELVTDLEKRGVEFGRSWKFNMRTAAKMLNDCQSYYDMYVSENNLDGRISFSYKNGKITHTSPLKGKEVAYEYITKNAYHDI